jgi:arsenate reductase
MIPWSGRVLHWGFEDPADAQGSEDDRFRVFRRVRDEIAKKIRAWLTNGDGSL